MWCQGGWELMKYVKPIWAWAVQVQIADFQLFVCGCSCGYGNGREKVDFQRMEVVQVSWWLQLQNEMECRCVAWCCSWEKSKAEPVMTLNISKPWNIWKTLTNHNRTGQPHNRGSLRSQMSWVPYVDPCPTDARPLCSDIVLVFHPMLWVIKDHDLSCTGKSGSEN